MSIWTEDDLTALKAAYKARVMGQTVRSVEISSEAGGRKVSYDISGISLQQLKVIIDELEGTTARPKSFRVRTSKD